MTSNILRLLCVVTLVIMICALPAVAQQPPMDREPGPAGAQGPGGPGWDRGEQGPGGPPPMGRQGGPGGPGGPGLRALLDPQSVQKLGLTVDQQKKIREILHQNRLRLIDLTAALQREEAILEPMLADDNPTEAKVLPQIDKVAQARAELEKANARMLLGLRGVLTVEQWKKLQSEHKQGGPPHNIHRMGHGQDQGGPGNSGKTPQRPM